MTETEWLSCDHPGEMSSRVGRTAVTERKLRLFAVAACRRADGWFADSPLRAAVDTAERFADGQATEAEMRGAYEAVRALVAVNHQVYRAAVAAEAGPESRDAFGRGRAADAVVMATCPPPFLGAIGGIGSVTRQAATAAVLLAAPPGRDARDEWYGRAEATEPNVLAGMVRDVFGNPFRPVAADPRWLTSTAVSLAQAIYAERAFDRLPILADALEEAGCDDADILSHCRGPGLHARGCWVVDLVLGKEA